jgi:hypothetical protein
MRAVPVATLTLRCNSALEDGREFLCAGCFTIGGAVIYDFMHHPTYFLTGYL